MIIGGYILIDAKNRPAYGLCQTLTLYPQRADAQGVAERYNTSNRPPQAGPVKVAAAELRIKTGADT